MPWRCMSSGDDFLLLLARSRGCPSQSACRRTSHCPSTLRHWDTHGFSVIYSKSCQAPLPHHFWLWADEVSSLRSWVVVVALASFFPGMAADILSWKSYPGILQWPLALHMKSNQQEPVHKTKKLWNSRSILLTDIKTQHDSCLDYFYGAERNNKD